MTYAEITEDHWRAYYVAIEPVRDAIRNALVRTSPSHSLNTGPQLDAVVATAVDSCVDFVDHLVLARMERDDARTNQELRDQEPPPAPEPDPPYLATEEPQDLRAWLKRTSPNELVQALQQVDDVARIGWANQMLEWSRQDGNRNEIIEILRAAQPDPITQP